MREGWAQKKIDEIAKFSQGIQVGLKHHETSPKEGYVRFIRILDYTQNTDDIRYVKNPGEKYFVDEDDIVMVRYGSPGLIGRGKAGVIANNLFKITITQDGITNDYLSKFLSQDHIQKFLSTQGSATMPALNFTQLKTIEVFYPKSLSEQKQIVAILDEAFAAIDQAKANIEKNIQNAKELFKSKFKNLFATKDESWVEHTLLALLDKGWITSHLDGNHGGDYPRKNEFVDSGVPYISANCLREGYVDFHKAKYLKPERASKLRKGIAQDGDVLFAHNATVGPTALLKTNESKVILGTSLTYYRCNQEYINPKYLLLYLRSKEFTSQYESIMRQSTRNQVPITKQRTFTHIIPTLEVQNALVPQLEKLNKNIEKMVDLYIEKLSDLEELKKSILQKAFAGELSASGLSGLEDKQDLKERVNQ